MDPNFPPPIPDPFWNPRPNPGLGPVDHHGRLIRPSGYSSRNVARDPLNPYGHTYGINSGEVVSPPQLLHNSAQEKKPVYAPSQANPEIEFFKQYKERVAMHNLLYSLCLCCPLMEDERELLERLEKQGEFIVKNESVYVMTSGKDNWLAVAMKAEGGIRLKAWNEMKQRGYIRQRQQEKEVTRRLAEKKAADKERRRIKEAEAKKKEDQEILMGCAILVTIAIAIIATGVYAYFNYLKPNVSRSTMLNKKEKIPITSRGASRTINFVNASLLTPQKLTTYIARGNDAGVPDSSYASARCTCRATLASGMTSL